MTGRRAAAGLSLLCALVFCAFAAPSASAAGTTAYTCVKGGGVKDFKDAHCDEFVGAEKGEFGHVLITEKETAITITNKKTANKTTESTPAVLKATVLTQKTEIICKEVHGIGTLTNTEEGGVMHAGGPLTVKYTKCEVPKPGVKCEVEEPIVVEGTGKTVIGLEGKEEMGLEIKPNNDKEGKPLPFTTIKFKVNAECLVSGASVPVEGTAIGTGSRGSSKEVTSSGGTLIFTEAMTEKTLKAAKNTAKFSNIVTIKMKLTKEEEEKGEDKQNAITLTTG